MTDHSPMDDVRAQYEALPYPPRDPRDEAIRLITGTPSHILEVNHYLFAGRLNFSRPFRALVAGGCHGELPRHDAVDRARAPGATGGMLSRLGRRRIRQKSDYD